MLSDKETVIAGSSSGVQVLFAKSMGQAIGNYGCVNSILLVSSTVNLAEYNVETANPFVSFFGRHTFVSDKSSSNKHDVV